MNQPLVESSSVTSCDYKSADRSRDVDVPTERQLNGVEVDISCDEETGQLISTISK